MKRYVIGLLILCHLPLITASAQNNDTVRVFTKEHPLVYEDAWDLWPYSFLNEEGVPVGYNIDLLKMVFEELHIPYTIKLKPTVDALRDLKAGKADLMLGMDAHFHNEYAKYGESVIQLFTHSVVHQKDHPTKIKTLNDLSRHKVIVHAGSFSHHLMIKKGWENNAIPYDDMQEAVQKAHLDPNSEIVWNTNSLKWLIAKYNYDDLELSPVDIQHGEYKFMSNNQTLLHQLDSVFMLLRAKERLQPIQNKWFYPERKNTGMPDWVWKVALTLIFIILGFFIYYLIYRFREKRMTKDLRTSNNRLALLLKTTKVRIWLFRASDHMITVLDDYGNTEDTYSSFYYADFTTPEGFAQLREAIARLLRRESEKEVVDIMAKDKLTDRKMRNYTMSMTVLSRDRSGQPTELIATRSDVTEERLAQKEAEEMMLRYQSIFNSAMTDMVYYDENGIITDMNQKSASAIPGGLEAVQKAHITLHDVLDLDIPVQDLGPLYLTQLYKKDDDPRVLNQLLKRDELYYELQLIPVRDDVQKLIGIYGTGRDVTEVVKTYRLEQEKIQDLKKVNDEMELYIRNIDYVLKNGGVRLAYYSPDTHTLDINNEIGRVQYRLTQTRALALVDEESKTITQRSFNIMDNRTTIPVSLTVKTTIHKNGLYLYLHLAFIPTREENGRVTGYFGMCRNVSEIMTTEKELEQKTAKAKEVETIKNAFLHNMSYEIRTPLNSVVGFAELFDMEHSPEDETIFINEIKQSSAQLLRLINDILFLSRLDAHMIELKTKPVDFAALFEPRCQACWFRLQKPEVTYQVESPYKHLVVDIDAQNLGIVIDKIASNAALNTEEGHVRARYDYTGDTLVIAFQDTGSGISEEKMKHLFERFNATDSQGTGLGLPICQEIISQMGGKITIKSEVGKGTMVWITVPCHVSDLERK